ncbi:MAG: hypothetical protein IPM61_10405 [Chlorobi bacterium]|nr:hypothetical protein [Chlorobiota bacterium]MBX7216530.1 hypothetical protein [Candidatus Kapabacteria bacterium]
MWPCSGKVRKREQAAPTVRHLGSKRKGAAYLTDSYTPARIRTGQRSSVAGGLEPVVTFLTSRW